MLAAHSSKLNHSLGCALSGRDLPNPTLGAGARMKQARCVGYKIYGDTAPRLVPSTVPFFSC